MQTKIDKLWELFTGRYVEYWKTWQKLKLENMDFVLVLFADGSGSFIMFAQGNELGKSNFQNLEEGIAQLENELFHFS